MLYAPNQGEPRGTVGLYVRVAGDPMSYAPAVQDAIWSIDSRQPITHVAPMSFWVDQWVAIPRATRGLVVSLAALAWLLSSLGVFGVVAYAVRTRRAELGIRLALGASPDRIEVDQLKAISPVVIAGVGGGLVLGVFAARAAAQILYGVSPLDPLSWGGAVLAMAAAAFMATYLPARRAGRIDPSEVIRTE
jgi:ABC-type antimicrobial peptide transport system permease subunit